MASSKKNTTPTVTDDKDAWIEIIGAREHNLKGIDLKIPREKLVVITGISGSGKSSLAFDTIYAEGQRRYLETFSAYARRFLGGIGRPDVERSTASASPASNKNLRLEPKVYRWYNHGNMTFSASSTPRRSLPYVPARKSCNTPRSRSTKVY
jgi:hypothetical protein